jgi:uncharacterized protein YndB with AHSA1/START domain
MNKTISVATTVKADRESVWKFWNGPEHIEKWMHASDDWECSRAVNDLKVGGRFSFTLAAKDKSSSFDFNGVYTEIEPYSLVAYTIEGGRKVTIFFAVVEGGVSIVETFEMEHENSDELQRNGWQATLDNFRKYAETTSHD